jgi:hypothetical protein
MSTAGAASARPRSLLIDGIGAAGTQHDGVDRVCGVINRALWPDYGNGDHGHLVEQALSRLARSDILAVIEDSSNTGAEKRLDILQPRVNSLAAASSANVPVVVARVVAAGRSYPSHVQEPKPPPDGAAPHAKDCASAVVAVGAALAVGAMWTLEMQTASEAKATRRRRGSARFSCR